MSINELFKTKKPIVAMLHLKALVGDPLYDEEKGMEYVVECAKKDLSSLIKGGVDAVIISNEFSLPYQRKVDFVTVASMAYVIGEIKPLITIPFGVDCISDGLATIELAAAVGANFVRGTFSGVYVGDGGFYNNDFSNTYRRKKQLNLDDLKMFYFLNPESDMNLDTRNIAEIARSLTFKVNPDAFCISAKSAGSSVDPTLIKNVKKELPNSFCFCNTGAKKETIEDILSYSDGAIVGTTFKKNGNFHNDVDGQRVKEFMEVVKNIRKGL